MRVNSRCDFDSRSVDTDESEIDLYAVVEGRARVKPSRSSLDDLEFKDMKQNLAAISTRRAERNRRPRRAPPSSDESSKMPSDISTVQNGRRSSFSDNNAGRSSAKNDANEPSKELLDGMNGSGSRRRSSLQQEMKPSSSMNKIIYPDDNLQSSSTRMSFKQLPSDPVSLDGMNGSGSRRGSNERTEITTRSSLNTGSSTDANNNASLRRKSFNVLPSEPVSLDCMDSSGSRRRSNQQQEMKTSSSIDKGSSPDANHHASSSRKSFNGLPEPESLDGMNWSGSRRGSNQQQDMKTSSSIDKGNSPDANHHSSSNGMSFNARPSEAVTIDYMNSSGSRRGSFIQQNMMTSSSLNRTDASHRPSSSRKSFNGLPSDLGSLDAMNWSGSRRGSTLQHDVKTSSSINKSYSHDSHPHSSDGNQHSSSGRTSFNGPPGDAMMHVAHSRRSFSDPNIDLVDSQLRMSMRTGQTSTTSRRQLTNKYDQTNNNHFHLGINEESGYTYVRPTPTRSSNFSKNHKSRGASSVVGESIRIVDTTPACVSVAKSEKALKSSRTSFLASVQRKLTSSTKSKQQVEEEDRKAQREFDYINSLFRWSAGCLCLALYAYNTLNIKFSARVIHGVCNTKGSNNSLRIISNPGIHKMSKQASKGDDHPFAPSAVQYSTLLLYYSRVYHMWITHIFFQHNKMNRNGWLWAAPREHFAKNTHMCVSRGYPGVQLKNGVDQQLYRHAIVGLRAFADT